MYLKSVALVFTFLSISASSKAQENGTQKDARWIIGKAIEAMGGEKYLRSITTLYTEMSTDMGGRAVTWITKEKLPNKGAFKIVHQGATVYEDRFDGAKGFELVNGEAKETDPSQLADKYPRKNIFNELDYLDESLYVLQLLPEEKVDGIACYKVSATFIEGTKRILYIDKSKFNTIREDKIRRDDPDTVSSTYYSKFKKFDGLLFYSVFRIGDGPNAQTAKVEKLLVNKEVAESDFSK